MNNQLSAQRQRQPTFQFLRSNRTPRLLADVVKLKMKVEVDGSPQNHVLLQSHEILNSALCGFVPKFLRQCFPHEQIFR